MLFVAGINHRTASLEIREKISLSVSETKQFLKILKEKGIAESFIVSTCNRTEIYGVLNDESSARSVIHAAILDLIRFKSKVGFVSPEHFYIHTNKEAIRHALTVASGLDSLVLGDVQILNQIRKQFSLSREMKMAGKKMFRLMEAVNRVGERVRKETSITSGAVSVSFMAVEYALHMFPDLKTKSTLLIGAGETGERAAKHIAARELGNLYVANRTIEKALELTKQFGGYVVDWNKLDSTIPFMDVIISSVSVPNYILSKEDLLRGKKQQLIIDISVPRSIDPEAGQLPNVVLYDLDSLNRSIEKTLPQRTSEIPSVQRIVTQETDALYETFTGICSFEHQVHSQTYYINTVAA